MRYGCLVLLLASGCLDYGVPAEVGNADGGPDDGGPDDGGPDDGGPDPVCDPPLPSGPDWLPIGEAQGGPIVLVSDEDGETYAYAEFGRTLYKVEGLTLESCAIPPTAPLIDRLVILGTAQEPSLGLAAYVSNEGGRPELCFVERFRSGEVCDTSCVTIDEPVVDRPELVEHLGRPVFAFRDAGGGVITFVVREKVRANDAGPDAGGGADAGAALAGLGITRHRLDFGASAAEAHLLSLGPADEVFLSAEVTGTATESRVFRVPSDGASPVPLGTTSAQQVHALPLGFFALEPDVRPRVLYAETLDELTPAALAFTSERPELFESFDLRPEGGPDGGVASIAVTGADGFLVTYAFGTVLAPRPFPPEPTRLAPMSRLYEGAGEERWAIGTEGAAYWPCGPQGEPVYHPLDDDPVVRGLADLAPLPDGRAIALGYDALVLMDGTAAQTPDLVEDPDPQPVAVIAVEHPEGGARPAVITAHLVLDQEIKLELHEVPGEAALRGPVFVDVGTQAATFARFDSNVELIGVDREGAEFVVRRCQFEPDLAPDSPCGEVARFQENDPSELAIKLRYFPDPDWIAVTTVANTPGEEGRLIKIERSTGSVLGDNTNAFGFLGSAPQDLLGYEPAVVDGCLMVTTPAARGVWVMDDVGNLRPVLGTDDLSLFDIKPRGARYVALGSRGLLYDLEVLISDCTNFSVAVTPEFSGRSSRTLRSAHLREGEIVVVDDEGALFRVQR